ncbi:aminotransferase class V-fold PLP-dependent enzyme [Hyphomicrobium sp.]|uniref:pyridoxal phosphate-dependent decarboxylase family protein n=1 Tax=Hyphomicrobium sp. TaxID=82 RepID=UPI0025BA7F1B|nr:aminotransferase class V-fold PLP-dependent enzyme [Hyphomicrobium sp.]
MTPAESSETVEATSLDPANWVQFREQAHAALDLVLSHVEGIRGQPVWQPPTPDALSYFTQELPTDAGDIDELLAGIRDYVVPFATGNLHPRFMGWVHGAGTPVGVIGELIAAGLDLNCGGRNHIGLAIERQVVKWMGQAFGYPACASGIFVTGSSMANFLAAIIAKTEALGVESRERGLVHADRPLLAYASSEAHSCIAQALQLSGIGSVHLRQIPVDEFRRMRGDQLERAIVADEQIGAQPFLVVGTAGTVNTGAIDPLEEIAAIAERHRLWFHVDGAIGALAMLSPKMKRNFSGLEKSDSIALDFHKWGHVPYDAGFLLVKDAEAHKRAFAQPAAYLQRSNEGLAAGDTWPCDLGVDLSRGCRALKTWLTLAAFGTHRIGASIEGNCALARYLADLVESSDQFVLKAPVALNIVCFGIRNADPETVRAVVTKLQLSGIAAPSWTTLEGESVVRCAIVNHRTTIEDIDIFWDALTQLAGEAAGK